ncbi:histidine phosphatase family protein [Ancylobacter radicis]|uniref:Histidine phosphatase family protein n=1 Tax=Ancylobacter radicis TaxID=2836179 RepID=A0ABS5R9D8_9HYPH|nr:histidine phosphatase family protein [Ancylobacter radicis]MBS9478294.1 histidine phosphatase family protein [Ancylobacter radicis]
MTALAALAGLAFATPMLPAQAAPKRIIIVRHGEKLSALSLCALGKERAQALAAQYLSPTSPMSLIAKDKPAAILAITLHTLETARPTAKAWGMRIATNPLMLMPIKNDRHDNALINVQNRRVARDLLENPRWHGTTVVMVWEHFHIASAALEQEFAGQEVTLRQLLNLDEVKGVPGGVPKTWPNSNYNFFWILDYDSPTATVPSRFSTVRQYFKPPYANLPSNDWGAPEGRPADSGCT